MTVTVLVDTDILIDASRRLDRAVDFIATLDGAADQPRRLSVGESLDWLKAKVWTLPILDRRTDEQILGYNAAGYCD